MICCDAAQGQTYELNKISQSMLRLFDVAGAFGKEKQLNR